MCSAQNGLKAERDRDGTAYVLKKSSGKWDVKVEYIDGDPGSYEAYKKLLQGIPDVILEPFTMKNLAPAEVVAGKRR